MSVSLSAERDRIQRQVEQLEQSLSATHTELELLSSETDDESDGEDSEDQARQSAAGLLAQREKIQNEILNLEGVLGQHSPILVSDDDDSSSEESELGLSPSADSCLQMNLVYQQVVQETLDQLEILLTQNHRQQKELSQLSGPIKESPRERPAPSSCQQPISMYLGRFLKPYFKDKLTGLGPPANEETKEKASRMTGCLDDKKLKVKRWESWQKTLLFHSVTRDTLKRLVQPKLSMVDYLSQKLARAAETDRQQLRQQINGLERDINRFRGRKDEDLLGDRYDEHDWQKISNIDFEGTRDAEDIRSFWQNFLHPSVSKTPWSKEEVQQLKEISRRHGERHWETIAEELGTGRTAFMCLQTFQRFVSDRLKRGGWTPVEDALLRELVDKMRIGNFIPYTQMSYFMEGRDPPQLIYRWNQVLDPSLKKGYWTKEEDQLLLQAVSRFGEKDWCKIRFQVPGRTDCSCRDRYYDCLKAGTKRGAFDEQERELLLLLVEKHGVGRWAKIAAEIPDRHDAQCLREWRKVSRAAGPPQAKKEKKTKKPAKSSGGEKTTTKTTTKIMKMTKAEPTKKRIRRRVMKVKEEESSEDDGMVVEYMDSDEEEKMKIKMEVVEVERVEKEVERVEEEVEKEEDYIPPPIQEWIPREKTQCFPSLRFSPVELPSSGVARNQFPVRSTILGEFGRSVILGPNPRELLWEENHSSSTMMMVSPDQLRAYLQHQADKFNNRVSGTRRMVQTDNPLGGVMDIGRSYELQAAVTPWIGNLLIPTKNKVTAANALREQGEKSRIPSAPFFLLFLQTMNLDAMGCKGMIEERRNKVVVLAPPPPPPAPSSVRSKTVAGILQQRKAMKQEQQVLDQQHKLILKQLQALQEQRNQQLQLQLHVGLQQLLLLQQPPPRPPPWSRSLTPSITSQKGSSLKKPPHLLSTMSSTSLPQALFIPQPRAPSIQLLTPPPAPQRPPLVGVLTSPFPAHPDTHRLTVPPVCMDPGSLNTTSTCSDSFRQQAVPFTQHLIVSLPPSPHQQVSTGSKPPSPHAAPSTSSSPVIGPTKSGPTSGPSSILSPPKWKSREVVEDQEAAAQSGESNGVVGACTGVDGASVGVIQDGRRIRKPSRKAKALQEASEAKAVSKKKAASSPPKRMQAVIPVSSQEVTAPVELVPQTPPSSLTTPPTAPQTPHPAEVAYSPLTKTTLPPAPLRLDATSACSDRSVSSTLNISLAPPPSITTNGPPAFSTSNLPAPFLNDHSYTILNLHPSQRGSNSVQPIQDLSPIKNNPKTLASRRKPRRRRVEQPNVVSSQSDRCVGGSETGVIQKAKRVRTPTQRARALQEATKAKDEAKKKRPSSSPCKKRPRTSPPEQEVVVQNQPMTQLNPGLCLLPGQSMFVMTPGGLVQLAQAPLQGLQLPLVPGAHLPAPPRSTATSPLRPQSIAARPPTTVLNQPCPLPAPPTSKHPAPTLFLQPVSNPGSSPLPPYPPQPSSNLALLYNATDQVDPAAPPHLRREALQFDSSLMFLEPQVAVCDWLSGQGGVAVPGVDMSLPYMPPFISTLSMLRVLLQSRRSLVRTSLQLLSRGSVPRCPPHRPGPNSSTETASSQHPDLPDSTSDLGPPQFTAGSTAPFASLLQEEELEEELLLVIRQLVAERFSGNPAYQLLKARFLSCFTVPALLATVQPIREKTVAQPANEEEEEEEEEELKKIKERGRRRKAERSLLLCDPSGASANHFSGINGKTSGPEPGETRPVRPDQTSETTPDQTSETRPDQ